MDDSCGAETPIEDLLRRVPLDARMIYEHSPISSSSIPVGGLARKALTKLDRLTAERDALQADAARYRWLRDMDEDPVCSLAAMWTDCKGSALSISKRVDAAVDAARGKNTT
jgi:hypothetical protein